MKILVVDENPDLLDTLEVGFHLQWEDATVIAAQDRDGALKAFCRQHPDVVLLGMDLPDEGSDHLLQEFRQHSDAWILAMSARGDEARQVAALEAGADAFVLKPFSHMVIVAQVRALLRRTRSPSSLSMTPDLECGDLAVNFEQRRVTVRGERVKLTPVEYRLLHQLMSNPGRVLPRQVLLNRIWSDRRGADNEHLKVFISRLRAKIGSPAGSGYIQTERGVGYRFVGGSRRVAPDVSQKGEIHDGKPA